MKIDKGVLQWFSHVERIEKDRIAKRIYAGECADSHSMGGLRKSGLIFQRTACRREVWMSGK